MPTLTAASRGDNHRKSVNAFVRAQIETGLGLRVHYEHAEPFDPLPTRWVDVATIRMSPQEHTVATGNGKSGAVVEFLLNLNFFERNDARRTGAATLYTLSTVVENVRQLLMPPAGIAVHDYDTVGNPQVGVLWAERPPAETSIDTSVNRELGITQVNLSATLKYVDQSID